MAESKSTEYFKPIVGYCQRFAWHNGCKFFQRLHSSILFYKYLSIHQEEYLVNNDLVDISDGKSVNEAYKELVEDAGLEACLIDIAGTLGYAINPEGYMGFFNWKAFIMVPLFLVIINDYLKTL